MGIFNFFAEIAERPLFVSPSIKTPSGLIFLKILSDLISIFPIVSEADSPAASK